MERALVTGATGFIGQVLCQELSSSGIKVVPLDRDWFVIPGNFDYIYHLGAYGNMHDQTEKNEIWYRNVFRTRELLEETKDMPYKKFVYVSTSAVDLPIQTPYSRSKREGEILCEEYNKPIIIVRPYSVTGVGEQKEHLIPTLIDAAYTGKTIFFVPKPVHDFIDVEDVVAAMIKIDKPGIYHLGSGIGRSNQEILDLVEYFTGKKIKINKVKSLREYDNRKWVARQSSAYKTLTTSIIEMIKDYDKKQNFKM